MKRKLLTVMALLIALCTAGCASTTEAEKTISAAETTTAFPETTPITTAEAAEETTTELVTEAATEAAETTTAETTLPETTAEIAEENSEIIAVAQKGYRALVERDIDNILEYVNIDAIYYLGTGEWVSEEKLAEQYKEATGEDDNNIFTWISDFENMKFLYAKRLTEEELQDFNDFIPEAADAGEVNYRFDDAYRVFISYDEMSENEKSLIGTDEGVHFLVVRYEGKWKLDYYVSIMRDLIDYSYSADE